MKERTKRHDGGEGGVEVDEEEREGFEEGRVGREEILERPAGNGDKLGKG